MCNNVRKLDDTQENREMLARSDEETFTSSRTGMINGMAVKHRSRVLPSSPGVLLGLSPHKSPTQSRNFKLDSKPFIRTFSRDATKGRSEFEGFAPPMVPSKTSSRDEKSRSRSTTLQFVADPCVRSPKVPSTLTSCQTRPFENNFRAQFSHHPETAFVMPYNCLLNLAQRPQ